VRQSIARFSEGEPKFDDITQLCLYYAGDRPQEKQSDTDAEKAASLTEHLCIRAEEDNLYPLLGMIGRMLAEAGCEEKAKKQIEMAVEEIFVNIADYAYPEGGGDADILAEIRAETKTAEITITDVGEAYNPLAKPDPDLNMELEQRQYGGFGIFMVKEAMDAVDYKRENGKNVLTLRKSWK
jgi:anti-sigma regulatory factor (Ser/Thr protein kinase)